jgi:hypothetical protein
MTAGAGLFGAVVEPRRRGRPKGAVNKRSRDLKGLIDARYGGSAAQQSAALCMVTPAELRRAKGSMVQAQVNKAVDLVKAVREGLVELGEKADAFGLADALALIARERAALLPYTDQRQPLAVELGGPGMAPSVVVMGAAPGGGASIDNAQVLEGTFSEVSPPKSHGEGQGPDLLGLSAPRATD